MDHHARGIWARRVLVVLLWAGAILAWRHHQRSNALSATDTAQQFIDLARTAWWGFFAYVAVYLARPVVLFPASVLTVVGGVLFGPVIGVVVVIVAANSSAMIAYSIGRLLGRAPVEHDMATSTEAASLRLKWSAKMRANSFETVLVMRFVFLPYDLVSSVAGALRIRWAPFLAATALGSLPGTISFVLLGASLQRVDEGLSGINPIALLFSVIIFVVSLLVARVLGRRQNEARHTQSTEQSTT